MEEHDIPALLEERRISRRAMLRTGVLGSIGLTGLGSAVSLLSESDIALAAGGSMSQIIAAAKRDGHLNVIALPPDWANYGQIMTRFQKKYGIPLSSFAPDDTSEQERQAIVRLRGQGRAPDVIDVGPSVAAESKQGNLLMQYKVATWSSIPTNMKDPAGYWTGDYWGVQSFATNLNVVKHPPQDWSDLMHPRYHGQVAIDGDPRAANDALSAVFAASLANGGSLNNIEPGINFFARLKKKGNFIAARTSTSNMTRGATPIAIKWDYLNLAVKQANAASTPFKVSIPATGVYGGFYCQAISKYAPHPNAAKLWQEFLYSDEGQLLFLKGFTHPARYQDLVRRNKVPAGLAAKLPPASSYQGVRFATQAQIDAAAKLLNEQWGPKVAGS